MLVLGGGSVSNERGTPSGRARLGLFARLYSAEGVGGELALQGLRNHLFLGPCSGLLPKALW